jgi:hypothetical protein
MAVVSRFPGGAVPGLLALTALTALTAPALAGCTSQGTIGASPAGGLGTGSSSASNPASASGSTSAGATASADATGTSAPTGPTTPAGGSSPATPASQDPSALASSLKVLNRLWTDQGCKTVLAGFSDYLFASQKGQAQGDAAIPAAVRKIRVGAAQTAKPGAGPQMIKMADDLQALHTEAQHGQTPDKGPLRGQWQIVGDMCSQQ